MPGPLLDAATAVMCAHGGRAIPVAPSERVRVNGVPIATMSGPWAIAGCALPPQQGGPCLTGQFTTGSARVTAGGQPVLLTDSLAVAAPTGTTLIVVSAQDRVRGT